MVAGTIGTRHRSPGGAATDRAGLHLLPPPRNAGRPAGGAETGHPLVTRHEFKECDRLWSMAVAPLSGCRHGPLQERLWDDHK
jgi:hypothetical protein